MQSTRLTSRTVTPATGLRIIRPVRSTARHRPAHTAAGAGGGRLLRQGATRCGAMADVAPTVPTTKLLYFADTYRLTGPALVLQCELDADGRVDVVLDQTLFYPQGGGQPCDVGAVVSDDGATLDVTDVRASHGVVHHYGTMRDSAPGFATGTAVTATVDERTRRLHARLHSAGHLLDCCMTSAGYPPERLMPTKGYHFPDAPYVEYKGKVEKEEIDALIEELNGAAAAIIARGSTVTQVVAQEMSYAEAVTACGGELPDYIPKDSAPRIVTIGADAGCPCGGTHVGDVAEIQRMRITGVRVKKGTTRVSYVID